MLCIGDVFMCADKMIFTPLEPAYFNCYGCGQKSEPSTGHWSGILAFTQSDILAQQCSVYRSSLVILCVGGGCIHAGRRSFHT